MLYQLLTELDDSKNARERRHRDHQLMRQKIKGLCKTYFRERDNMSKTAQGLLLEEIYDGQMKTQREHLLKRIPCTTEVGDDVSDNDGQDDGGNDGDDGNDGGESPYTRTHGTKRFNYDVDDDDDDMDDDELLDSVSVRASEPRASSEASLPFRTPTASRRSVNGLRIPGRDAALPDLDRLASQVSADSMRAHAVSAHSETPSRGL
ncbi:unnamed protein product, partial [Tilletia caries]